MISGLNKLKKPVLFKELALTGLDIGTPLSITLDLSAELPLNDGFAVSSVFVEAGSEVIASKGSP